MSGHSKWHSIKHAKGAADAARRKSSLASRQIEVAARAPVAPTSRGNPSLRHGDQARESSMPKDNIERAIKRGTGELEGVTYESVNYEGYAPHGVAVYVETLTDNRNRTGAEIKNIFRRNGGSLAEPGAVAWQFERKGVIILDKSAGSEDELMLAAPGRRRGHRRSGRHVADHDAARSPQQCVMRSPKPVSPSRAPISRCCQKPTIALDSEASAKQVLHVIDALEEHDDVQNVYANFDIPDSVLASRDGLTVAGPNVGDPAPEFKLAGVAGNDHRDYSLAKPVARKWCCVLPRRLHAWPAPRSSARTLARSTDRGPLHSGPRHLHARRRQARALHRQAHLPVSAAGRHRQGGGQGLRHRRADRCEALDLHPRRRASCSIGLRRRVDRRDVASASTLKRNWPNSTHAWWARRSDAHWSSNPPGRPAMDLDVARDFVRQHHRAVMVTNRADGPPPTLARDVRPRRRRACGREHGKPRSRPRTCGGIRRCRCACSARSSTDPGSDRRHSRGRLSRAVMEPLVDYYRTVSGEHPIGPVPAAMEHEHVIMRRAHSPGPNVSG